MVSSVGDILNMIANTKNMSSRKSSLIYKLIINHLTKNNMKFSPKPKMQYILDKKQDQCIFAKLAQFQKQKLSKEKEKLVKFLYTQLETDWRTPLEKFIDKLLKQV